MGPRHAFLNLFIPVESDRPLLYVGARAVPAAQESSDAPTPLALPLAKPVARFALMTRPIKSRLDKPGSILYLFPPV